MPLFTKKMNATFRRALIDDVLTTGATLSECARFEKAGASSAMRPPPQEPEFFPAFKTIDKAEAVRNATSPRIVLNVPAARKVHEIELLQNQRLPAV
jgi:hypothetical protein